MDIKLKITLWAIAGIAIAILALIITCDRIVANAGNGKIYDDAKIVPHRTHGLLLGTSPFWYFKRRNMYFETRIQAASELYKAGGVDTIIASGGDYTAQGNYNELTAMHDSLVAHGVPSERIILDYDGVRTIRSIENAKEKYELDSVTIISQEFHNRRALYQAKSVGVDAIAYNAATPDTWWIWIKNRGREYLARVKTVFELMKRQS